MGPTSRTAAAVAKKKVRSRTCARVDARFEPRIRRLPERALRVVGFFREVFFSRPTPA
jgi:hypothetical protein